VDLKACWILRREDLTFHRIVGACRGVGGNTLGLYGRRMLCGGTSPSAGLDIISFSQMLPDWPEAKICEVCFKRQGRGSPRVLRHELEERVALLQEALARGEEDLAQEILRASRP